MNENKCGGCKHPRWHHAEGKRCLTVLVNNSGNQRSQTNCNCETFEGGHE